MTKVVCKVPWSESFHLLKNVQMGSRSQVFMEEVNFVNFKVVLNEIILVKIQQNI